MRRSGPGYNSVAVARRIGAMVKVRGADTRLTRTSGCWDGRQSCQRGAREWHISSGLGVRRLSDCRLQLPGRQIPEPRQKSAG